MRLGDLDALEKRMNERLNFLRKAYGEHDDYVRGFDEGCVAVENAPTIDPKSLRPHGRCDYCKDGKSFIGQTILLANDGKCHTINYCPNCGADMRG